MMGTEDMNPRAVVAEDEPLLAQQLQNLLARAWPELSVVDIAANGPAALEAIERQKPEVAFLDIRMPGMTGLEVAEELLDRLGERMPAIVFVTAYDEFALKAFDLAAADYLLKPVTEVRLARCVERLKARLQAPLQEDTLVSQMQQIVRREPTASSASPLRILRAGIGDTVKMIPIDEVCYFQASDKYTGVVTKDGEALIRIPLKELLEQLPPGRFVQIHRGTIVNLEEVAAAVRDDAGRVSLKLRSRKEALAVSRLYADQFRQM
jgi:DNA-binding LytR/AlgR family response regulator